MVNPTCPVCTGSGTDPKTQASCIPCGGDGTLNLLDPGFLEQQVAGMLDDSGYLVWAVLYLGLLHEMEELSDLKDKVNDVTNKCDDILEKLNE